MKKMSLIGEMEVVLVITALLYWCVSKSYGTYFLMGWSANRVVNGLLKVTARGQWLHFSGDPDEQRSESLLGSQV